MNIVTTSRALKEYILALKIARKRQPLFSVDESLNLYPELIIVCELLEGVWNEQTNPYRGQRKVRFDIPEALQTNNLNRALKYGFEQIAFFEHPKQDELTALDKAYAIAMANILAPIDRR